jgi:hypothetical protein
MTQSDANDPTASSPDEQNRGESQGRTTRREALKRIAKVVALTPLAVAALTEAVMAKPASSASPPAEDPSCVQFSCDSYDGCETSAFDCGTFTCDGGALDDHECALFNCDRYVCWDSFDYGDCEVTEFCCTSSFFDEDGKADCNNTHGDC